jgi:hypothetical protein
LNILWEDGKIWSIKVKYGKYNIEFKDSYLMLLASLLKLGKGFGIDTIKSVFHFLIYLLIKTI